MEKKKLRFRLPKTGAVYGIVIFIVLYSILLKGQYLTLMNIENVLRQSAELCILSIAAFLAMVSGQSDLSIGTVSSLSAVVMGLLLKKGVPLVAAIALALLSGMAIGLINGLIAGFTTVPAFLVTFSTMNIALGIALVLNSETINVSSAFLKSFNSTSIWIIPVPAIVTVALYLLFFWIMKFRKYGTKLYAVGGRADAALTAGINVKLIKMSVYIINGALAGLAGIVCVARLNAANPTQGSGMELEAIAAAVLGGTSTAGGQGSIWGAYLGALAMVILKNGMNLLGVRIIEQQLVIGLVLIFVLAFDIFNRKEGLRR
jgi:ribose transport system permease protein